MDVSRVRRIGRSSPQFGDCCGHACGRTEKEWPSARRARPSERHGERDVSADQDPMQSPLIRCCVAHIRTLARRPAARLPSFRLAAYLTRVLARASLSSWTNNLLGLFSRPHLAGKSAFMEAALSCRLRELVDRIK